MATSLTFDEIISNAGKLVGNETLTTFAGVWLNNIIDTIAQNRKFFELEKVATGTLAKYTSGPALTVSFPTDFGDMWDHNALGLIDSGGSHHILTFQTWDWYDLITNPLTIGPPQFAAFDMRLQKWTPYPQPDQAYTWQMRYVLKPSRIVTGSDKIPYGSDEIFIQALFVRLLQFEDDARYPAEYAMLDQMLNKYFGGANMSPIKSPAVRFNSKTFKSMGAFR